MRPRSLRIRLLLASALSIVLALTVAGMGLSALFSDHVQRGIRANLEAELNRLAALIDIQAPALALQQPMSDPRFGAPYGGLYWQIRDPLSGQIARSRSMWDRVLTLPDVLPPDGAIAAIEVIDPEGNPAVALARRLSFERGSEAPRQLDLVVAQDNEVLNSANAAYRLNLAAGLAVLAIVLTVAAWFQVTLGLSPLALIRRGINAIRTGQSTSLEGDYPSEVMPLVTEVNELSKAHDVSIAFARARAADLAHGLKTSLTVLNAEADELRRGGNEDSAAAIEQLTAEMAQTIDHQLRLSRLRHRLPSGYRPTPLAEAVQRVVATLRKTAKGAELAWQVEIPPPLIVSLDGSDLTELLGVVLENAAKWARAKVLVRAGVQGGLTRLTIDDDGPGVSAEKLKAIGKRGQRLDEVRSGSGIGLSIAREIAGLNNGTIEFATSALGGLSVSIALPTTPAGSTL